MQKGHLPVIRVGVIAGCAAAGLPAAAIACDRAPLQEITAATPITVMIDPACLTDPEDTGVILADLAMQLVAAHMAVADRPDFTATREVLVETFVSEILEPTLSAN